MKKEKVYKAEFMEYTNYAHNWVSDGGDQYLEIGTEPFLIKESDLDKYNKFGKGFEVIR